MYKAESSCKTTCGKNLYIYRKIKQKVFTAANPVHMKLKPGKLNGALSDKNRAARET